MSGPRLVGAVAIVIGAMCAAIIATTPDPTTAAHAIVRWTARTSAVLFALAYVARPAAQLWPSARTKAVLARRTWIGLSFATSHAFHLAGIVWIAALDPALFVATLNIASYLGAIGFVLIAAMAVTSKASIRRRMSKRAWTLLHRTGMHAFWFVFAATYAGRIGVEPVFAAPLAVFVAIAGVRCAAYVRTRRRAGMRVAAAA